MIRWTTSMIKRQLSCSRFTSESNKKPVLAFERGSYVHEVLEKGLGRAGKEYSEYRGKKQYYQLLTEADFIELDEVAKYVFDTYPEYLGDKVVTIKEETFTVGIGNIELSGIMDLLKIEEGNLARIVDWKTGVSRANPENPIDMLQAYIYSYLIYRVNKDIEKVVFEYVYVEGSPDENVTLVTERKDVQSLHHGIMKYIGIAADTGYKAGQSCSYCDEQLTCPLTNAILGKPLERLTYKEARVLKNALETVMKNAKEQYLEEAERDGDFKRFSSYSSFYVTRDSLSIEQLRALVKDEVKVSKAKAHALREQGAEILERKTHRFKG